MLMPQKSQILESPATRVKEGWGEVSKKQNSLGLSSIPEKKSRPTNKFSAVMEMFFICSVQYCSH